ncbi:MAG: PfkB family carbohydrate kinase [Candidatus Gastranaerophilales bacterium]|nr:PfkB family carbohydrate kinase [Candidatus Gastranaerophilales bacterium]
MFLIDKPNIKDIIQNLSKGSILVIGDFAIDEMIYGQTSRISREAPVLILKHTHTNIILGAASNAANNISSLNNGKVLAIGVYGDDYHGPILMETLQKSKIDTTQMVLDKNRPTSTKTRISGFSTQSVTQQIVRIDKEIDALVSENIESEIIEKIEKSLPNCDGVILSDYATGMMTEKIIKTTISLAKKYNIPVAVDTQQELSRFQGVTVLTPNQPDAEKDLGYQIKDEKTLLKAGRDLLDKTSAEMILLTRGGDGMILFERNGKITNIPAFNKTDVFDVTGAGDTVVASFILALASGASAADAATIGNLAASIVVRHFGCATTTIDELIKTLDNLKTDTFILAKG